MDNNFSTPKQQSNLLSVNNGSVLRSRSNSSPSSTSIPSSSTSINSTPKTSINTSGGSIQKPLVFSSNENAKKQLNMDSTSTPTGLLGKKRSSIAGSSLLPPSSIPLPPSQQSAKKDTTKRHSTSIIPTSSTTTSTTTTTPSSSSRPSTPQPQQIQSQQQVNISSILESNNSEILNQNQNQNQKQTFSTSQNTAFSSSINASTSSNTTNTTTTTTTTTTINSLNNSGSHLQHSNSSTSTPSPTMIISNTSPPPELSLEGFSNSHSNETLMNSKNALNLNLSPNSQSNNIHNHVNRSSSPSPTSMGGRRTPIQMFSSSTGSSTSSSTTSTTSSKSQPLFYDKEESIQAVCRFRPEIAAEQILGLSEKQLTISTDQASIYIASKSNTSPTPTLLSSYKFSKVYQPATTQETFYNEVGKPLIDDIVNGYNVGIIAYGQTGAGKTYTTMGSNDHHLHHDQSFNGRNSSSSSSSSSSQTQQGWGITPRMMKDLFQRQLELEQNSSQKIKFTTKLSFLEVYKEKVYDLLSNVEGNNDLEIRLNSEGGFSVPDATQMQATNFNDFITSLQIVEKKRRYSELRKNISSSRSHLLFIVSIIKEDLDNKQTVTSLLHIVDLAGSESASKIDININGGSSTVSSRKKISEETGFINKSLFALGGVIEDMLKKSKYVRYRDSKLTQLLHQCFGGNSKTCLIVNCSCSSHESVIRETIQSLDFGQRCQSVRNKPSQNVEESHSELKNHITRLKQENEEFRKFIEKTTQHNGVMAPSQVAAHIIALQSHSDEQRKKYELLLEDIRNLDEELKVKDYELKEKDSHIEEFDQFFQSNKNNLSLIEQLRSELEVSENLRTQLENSKNELQFKFNQLIEQLKEAESELSKSLGFREELLGHLKSSKERVKDLEINSKLADELKIKLTSSMEQLTSKQEQLSNLETQKQKWKSKCAEITNQLKESQDRLNILQNTTDNNESEQIKSLKYKLIELQSNLNQTLDREKSLQKEIDSTKLKNNEQTLIMLNLKNQMDIITNKMEIQFPTIVNSNNNNNNNNQLHHSTSSSSSTSTTNSNNNSVENNLLISMSSIENLFEKISKNQEYTNTIITTNVESIMGKLVEIDENEEFIKKERERDNQITLSRNKSLEEAQSNFLKQQEEIKKLINNSLINNSNNNNNNNNSGGGGGVNGSSSKFKKNNMNSDKLKNNNSIVNFGKKSFIIILSVFLSVVVLFFLMLTVGLILQNQENNRNSYFTKIN